MAARDDERTDGPARGLILALLVAVAGVAGCNFDVTNPGPVADEFLDEPGAYEAVVNGIGREMNDALNWIGVDVAIRTRELHATQANDYIGIEISAHNGTADLDALDTHWNSAQRTRWLGEDAIERFQESMESGEFQSHPEVARAHLWAGYANRLMGEYFCEAVFDGGSPQPGDAYFERAQELFGTAIQIGQSAGVSDVVTAARAGRASARVHLGDWAGAVEDASGVPTGFQFELPYYDTGDWRYYNALYWYGNSGEPWRGLTVWNTYYRDYADQMDDPRVSYAEHPDQPFGAGSLDPWGQIPWLTQGKYTSPAEGIDLSSGEEMRLVEAEAMLRDGNMSGAMQIISDLRSRAGAEPWPAPATMEEAWTILKAERGIELWMEGRRLGDRRRWAENDVPGELSDYELGLANDGPDLTDAMLCLPIPTGERETNQNVGG